MVRDFCLSKTLVIAHSKIFLGVSGQQPSLKGGSLGDDDEISCGLTSGDVSDVIRLTSSVAWSVAHNAAHSLEAHTNQTHQIHNTSSFLVSSRALNIALRLVVETVLVCRSVEVYSEPKRRATMGASGLGGGLPSRAATLGARSPACPKSAAFKDIAYLDNSVWELKMASGSIAFPGFVAFQNKAALDICIPGCRRIQPSRRNKSNAQTHRYTRRRCGEMPLPGTGAAALGVPLRRPRAAKTLSRPLIGRCR